MLKDNAVPVDECAGHLAHSPKNRVGMSFNLADEGYKVFHRVRHPAESVANSFVHVTQGQVVRNAGWPWITSPGRCGKDRYSS